MIYWVGATGQKRRWEGSGFYLDGHSPERQPSRTGVSPWWLLVRLTQWGEHWSLFRWKLLHCHQSIHCGVGSAVHVPAAIIHSLCTVLSLTHTAAEISKKTCRRNDTHGWQTGTGPVESMDGQLLLKESWISSQLLISITGKNIR